jgi:hypothetical protein
MKIPLPMMPPMTIMVASKGPRRRAKPGVVAGVGSFVMTSFADAEVVVSG